MSDMENGSSSVTATGLEVVRPSKQSSSAPRVRAYRERKRAAGRRVVSVYLSDAEFHQLQELAQHFEQSVQVMVGACIRDVRKRLLAKHGKQAS